MSQELKENPPDHLRDPTLEQLTTLGNILKQNFKYESGLPAPHRLPTPPLFSLPPVPPFTPPRVPNGTENPSPPPRVKPNQRLPADAVPGNSIGTPPRVGPPRRSARLSELLRQEEAKTLRDDGPSHRTRSHTRTVSQEAMFTYTDIMQINMSPRKLAVWKFLIETINAVLNEEIGELMEYQQVMKNPKYHRLYETAYSKEMGRLAQGMSGQAEFTATLLFNDKSSVPVDLWRDITYGRVVVNYRPGKDDPYRVWL